MISINQIHFFNVGTFCMLDCSMFFDVRTPLQTCLSPQHAFDSVARERIEEKDQKDDQHQPEEDLDDGPLVVVPDDVANGLDGVEEPHEGRVRTSETRKNSFVLQIQ